MTPPPPSPPRVSIRTCRLFFNGTYNCSGYTGPVTQQTQPDYRTASSSSMKINSRPTIISFLDGPRISWIADYSGTYDPWQTKTTLCRLYPNIYYWNYTHHSRSASINKLDNNSKYYLAWSQVYNTQGYTDVNWAICNVDSLQPYVLNTHGWDVQLCNGTSNSNMFVSSFYPSTSPYYFSTSNSLQSAGLGKTTANSISNRRGVVLENNNAGLYYSFGNMIVNGNIINFSPQNDLISTSNNSDSLINIINSNESNIYNSIDTVNSLFISESFDLNENSNFEFNEYSGVEDSSSAAEVLGKNGYVSFKVELIDAISNKVIGTIKESTFTSSTLHPYELLSFKLNRDNLIEQTVKIKITVATNIANPKFALVDEYIEADDGIHKSGVKELTLKNTDIVTVYNLAQNYPNPFNPSTTIKYQISKDGLVTIKIYDILGKEVKNLVNEQKTTGRYEVKFDASNLATGVYVYRLSVNDFVSVKKMMLIK